MSEIITVGLDLAKNEFQAHGADASGQAVLRKKPRREQVLAIFGQLPPCVVAMEACGGAHFWGREIGCVSACNFAPSGGVIACNFAPPLIWQTVRCGAADGGELKRVDTIARVRQAFHIQGWSMKKIARDLHLSRNTVRKILRSTFAHRRKVFMVSTPTIRGLSRIEREFEASDQRRYFVPCPHCGHMQWLQFERLRWAKGRPETATYQCAGCEHPIAEHHKTEMLARGEWRTTAVATDPTTIGFHLSALYSPIGWKSWEQIARNWLAAQGSDDMRRAARNTLLGETWIESGEAPEWQRLADRREVFAAQIPAGGLFLTAGADVPMCRRTASRSMSGPGGVVWKAGSSITSSFQAGQTIRRAGRS